MPLSKVYEEEYRDGWGEVDAAIESPPLEPEKVGALMWIVDSWEGPLPMLVYLDEYRAMGKATWPRVPKTPWGDSPGLYIMFTRSRIMYVGMAQDLGLRLWQHIFHRGDNLRKKVSCRYWYCVVKIVPSRSVRIEAEKALIRRLRPVYNVQYNG